MHKRHVWTILFLLTFMLSLSAQKAVSLAKLRVLSTANVSTRLADLAQKRPLVLIFMEAECPITQKYVPILRGLQNDFPNVAFAAVFTRWNTLDDVRTFEKDFDLKIPAFVDPRHQVVKKMKAKTTPEAFLVTPDGAIIYRGAIDNWYFGLGKHRQEPNAHFLKDAIGAFLSNQDIKIKQTDAVGCIIER